jgi:hypothetical protein
MPLMRLFFPAFVQETGPVHEVEMIQLSSWEWFLLLSIVILIIWLLILFQVKTYGSHEYGMQPHDHHEDHSGNDFPGSKTPEPSSNQKQ